MTPQEKAQELVKRFENGLTVKDCALIAVDEILNTIWEYHLEAEFWQEVRYEIEKL